MSEGYFATAVRLSLEPELFFGRRLPRSFTRAWLFALACEAMALGSYVAPLTWYSMVGEAAAVRAERLALGFGLWFFATAGVVLLHWLWGASIELGLWWGNRPSSASDGFRFSSYTCGWDFVTSPAGFVYVALYRRAEFARIVKGALSSMRVGMNAYLVDHRRLDREGVRVAERGAIVGVALGLFALLVGVGYGSWLVVSRVLE